MNTNDVVPDLSFQRPDGSTVLFSELLHGDCTFVIFMRHFACMPCVAQVKDVARRYDQLKDAGIDVVAVGHAPPAVTARFVERDALPFAVVTDVTKASYKAMGLMRVPFYHFFRPRIVWDAIKLLLRGEKIRRLTRTEDILQLGGDFLIDRDRRILYAYPSVDATDRAGAETMLSWKAKHLAPANAR